MAFTTHRRARNLAGLEGEGSSWLQDLTSMAEGTTKLIQQGGEAYKSALALDLAQAQQRAQKDIVKAAAQQNIMRTQQISAPMIKLPSMPVGTNWTWWIVGGIAAAAIVYMLMQQKPAVSKRR